MDDEAICGFSDAKSTNERFKELLNNGQSGLSVAFDLPTQLGLNSDSELAEGEVGKVGGPSILYMTYVLFLMESICPRFRHQ